MSLFANYARSTTLYKALCTVVASKDGNLLEATDAKTAESQIEFLRWTIALANPKVIIETGTNKGMFGYLVSLLLNDVEIHTVDIVSGAGRAVRLLNEYQRKVKCFFYEGDSRLVFPRLVLQADFAWLDGGHETDVVASDFLQCYRLGIPFVAVDDTAYPSVKSACDYIVQHTPYRGIGNPFVEHDRRQAMLYSLLAVRP